MRWEKIVRRPLNVAGTQQYVHPAVGVAAVLAVQAFEDGEIVVNRQIVGGEEAPEAGCQVRGEAGKKLLVVRVDDAILAPVVDRERRPHSHVIKCPEHLVKVVFQPLGRGLPVVVHDRGGARFNHLHGGEQGHQVVVVGAAGPAVENPGLQRVIAIPHLQAGNAAAVVMGIDQPREHDVVGPAYLLIRIARSLQLLISSHLLDYAVPLKYRAVGDDCA